MLRIRDLAVVCVAVCLTLGIAARSEASFITAPDFAVTQAPDGFSFDGHFNQDNDVALIEFSIDFQSTFQVLVTSFNELNGFNPNLFLLNTDGTEPLLERLEVRLAERDAGPDDFQRDRTAERFVPRVVHLAHTTGAKQLDDGVARGELLTGLERGDSGGLRVGSWAGVCLPARQVWIIARGRRRARVPRDGRGRSPVALTTTGVWRGKRCAAVRTDHRC